MNRFFARTAPARPLGVARIAVAGAVLLKAALIAPMLLALRDPAMLRVPGVSWLPVLPRWSPLVILGVWVLAGAAFLVGWRTRIAGALLSAALFWTVLGDQQLYSNHLYLAATLTALLTLADSGTTFSLDARRRGPGTVVVRAWPVTLLKLQVSFVYGFAALTKLNLTYVSGAVLNWNLGRDALIGFPEGLRRWEVMAPLALLSILVEAFLAVALWSERWRSVGFGLGFAFHAAIVLTISPAPELLVFSVLMFALYLLFLDDEVRSRRVLWDDRCSFCGSWVRWLRRLDWLRLHRFVGTSNLDALPAGVTRAEATEAIQLLEPGGRSSGFDAVRRMLEALPVTFLWAPYLRNRLVTRLGRRAYDALARRRHCLLPEVSTGGE